LGCPKVSILLLPLFVIISWQLRQLIRQLVVPQSKAYTLKEVAMSSSLRY